MVRDQVKMKGVTKGRLMALPIPLGQAHTDRQGRCRVAIATSCCANAEDAYDEMNHIYGEGCPRRGAYLPFFP